MGTFSTQSTITTIHISNASHCINHFRLAILVALLYIAIIHPIAKTCFQQLITSELNIICLVQDIINTTGASVAISLHAIIKNVFLFSTDVFFWGVLIVSVIIWGVVIVTAIPWGVVIVTAIIWKGHEGVLLVGASIQLGLVVMLAAIANELGLVILLEDVGDQPGLVVPFAALANELGLAILLEDVSDQLGLVVIARHR